MLLMVMNIVMKVLIMICSDNVPVVERVACRVRAQVAGAAVAGFDCHDGDGEEDATVIDPQDEVVKYELSLRFR